MPIPWLSAIKAIPWDTVVEHAPKVLGKARDLIDRQRSSSEASTPPPSLEPLTQSEIETHLATARMEIKELQEKQKSLEAILSEITEQQAAIVSQVNRLRRLNRWISALLIVLGASLWFFLH
jgi:FtsZ-binding cell division protein ZapB